MVNIGCVASRTIIQTWYFIYTPVTSIWHNAILYVGILENFSAWYLGAFQAEDIKCRTENKAQKEVVDRQKRSLMCILIVDVTKENTAVFDLS